MNNIHPEQSGIPCWIILWDYILSSFPFCPPLLSRLCFGGQCWGFYKYCWFIYIWDWGSSNIQNLIYSEPRGSPSRTPFVDYIFPSLQLLHHHYLPVFLLFFSFFFHFIFFLSFFFFFLLLWIPGRLFSLRRFKFCFSL